MAQKKKTKLKRKDPSKISTNGYNELPTSESTVYSLSNRLYKRRFTDCCCALLFLICSILLLLISIYAIKNGNPNDLLLPKDSDGRICGREKDVKDKQLLVYHDLFKCFKVSTLTNFECTSTIKVCVHSCPINDGTGELKNYCFNDKFGNKTCPSYILKSRPLFNRCIPEIIINQINATLNGFKSETINDLKFIDKAKEAVIYLNNLVNFKLYFESLKNDLKLSYKTIIAKVLIGLILLSLWLLFIRFLIYPIFWANILIVITSILVALYLSVIKTIELNEKYGLSEDININYDKLLDFDYIHNKTEFWLIISIILTVFLVILLAMFIFLRKRIQLAIELIRESSKTILDMPSSLFWPFIPLLLKIGIIIYGCNIFAYLSSSKVPYYRIMLTNSSNIIQKGNYCNPIEFNVSNCIFDKYSYNLTYPFVIAKSELSNYYFLIIEYLNNSPYKVYFFILFMIIWLISFIDSLNQITLAGVFSSWYWTKYSKTKKGEKRSLPSFPVFYALRLGLINHIGTLALGSLLLSLTRLIRFVLELIDRKIKKYLAKNNKLVKFIHNILRCFFWLLEKFILFTNKNAYIITSIFGYNYTKSSEYAFSLVLRNIIHVKVVDCVTSFVLFLSKLSITALTGLISYYFYANLIPFETIKEIVPLLNYTLTPVFIILLAIYLISKMFFDVFDMCIDTLFVCVLIDLEVNDGSKGREYFMSLNLRRLLRKPPIRRTIKRSYFKKLKPDPKTQKTLIKRKINSI